MNDDFETALGDALADLAKVDRSTTEQVRASISLLPDRRSSRLSRFGRSISLPRGGRRPLAVAGALAIVVTLAGFALLGPLQTGPVAPASPTLSSPSASTPGPSAIPTPTSTGSGPRAVGPLPVVYTAADLSVAGWSPDGSKFAILEASSKSPSGSVTLYPTVHLFDRTGAAIGIVPAAAFAWLDSTSYVILSPIPTFGGPGASQVPEAYLGRIGSTQQTALGNYSQIVAGPSGAVALMQSSALTVNPQPSYVVLSTDGRVSAPRSGLPKAWSRDGTMLAVTHLEDPRQGASMLPGWIEVVRPTGESVVSARAVESTAVDEVVFSPDGARVAFWNEINYAPKEQTIAVLETASGRVTKLPKAGPFVWANADQLLFAYFPLGNGAPGPDDRIMAWSASTGQLTDFGPGEMVAASGEGVVITAAYKSPTLTWADHSAGSTAGGTLTLGAVLAVGIAREAWSPDGSAAILIAGGWPADDMSAVLFRP